MMRLLLEYIQILLDCFQYDIEVFSQGWLYYWALIPGVFYFIFFLLKWMVLLMPIWFVPVVIVAAMGKYIIKSKGDEREEGTRVYFVVYQATLLKPKELSHVFIGNGDMEHTGLIKDIEGIRKLELEIREKIKCDTVHIIFYKLLRA